MFVPMYVCMHACHVYVQTDTALQAWWKVIPEGADPVELHFALVAEVQHRSGKFCGSPFPGPLDVIQVLR